MPIIQIHILEGRSLEQKRALVANVTEAVSRSLGCPTDRVRILIDEMKLEHFSQNGELYYDKKSW